MRHRPFQLSFRQRFWLYGAFSLTVGTGAIWAIIWHFLREESTMAEPVENTLLKAHLAGALVLLVALGAALPKHASKAWAAKINRPASAVFIGSILGSVVTGYGILAFSWETQLLHFTHIGIGVAMALLLPLHILVGRALEKKRIAAKAK